MTPEHPNGPDRTDPFDPEGPPARLSSFLRHTATLAPDARLEALRRDQARRWRRGERVSVETYLAAHPDLAGDPEAAVELIYREYLLREAAGEAPTLDEYRQRLPQYADRLALQLALRAALDDPGQTLSQNTAGASPAAPRLPGYEVLAELGRGGMGVVYKARQVPLNRTVALKMVLDGAFASAEARRRFLIEAEVIARLHHPNIVQVYEYGSHEGLPYFTLEYVEGGTLADRLRAGPLPPRSAAELVRDLAHALDHAHRMGVVHRDLKPANVLLRRKSEAPNPKSEPEPADVSDFEFRISDFEPKVSDFGLARDTSSEQTRTGAVLGTPGYMAPEQARGEGRRVGPAADVYALGAILYECLTGRPPFRAGTAVETIRQVTDEEAPSARSIRPGLPRDVTTIAHKCLAKEPAGRYASAAALADDLTRFLNDEPITARPDSSWGRLRRWARRNPALAALSASLLTLLTLVAIGSSIAAARFLVQRDQLRGERSARLEQLYAAQLAQARAGRTSRRIGQRHDSLQAVRGAMEVLRELALDPAEHNRRRQELRTEAIAALALADLRPIRELDWPYGVLGFSADASLSRYAYDAIGDSDSAVIVRAVADGAVVARLGQKGTHGHSPQLSPDGGVLAVQDTRSYRWGLWSLADGPVGEPPRLPEVPDDWAGLGAFSPDGRWFVVARPGALSWYDLTARRLADEWETHLGEAVRIAVHPTRRRVAVAADEAIHILDSGGRRPAAVLKQGGAVTDLAWHPDGATLAVAVENDAIHLWDVTAGRPVMALRGHQSGGIGLAFDRTGALLASCGWDKVLFLWCARSGRPLLRVPAGGVLPPHFAAGADRLCAMIAGRLVLGEVTVPREYRTLTPVDAPRLLPIASPDGRLLAVSGGTDGDTAPAGLWDLADGRPVAQLPVRVGDDRFAGVLLEPGPSGGLLTAGAAGLFYWPRRADPAGAALRFGPPRRSPAPLLPNNHKLFGSRDARALITPCLSGAVIVRRDDGDRQLPHLSHLDCRYAALSPDGRYAVTGVHTETGLIVWDAVTGQPIKNLLPKARLTKAAFSPDGTRLATSGADCRVWETGTWRLLLTVEGARVAWADDGLLAVETGTGVVRLLDPATGAEYARLEDPNQDVSDNLLGTPGGARLVGTKQDDHVLFVWDLRLLRTELAKLGLDWDRPSYPPAPDESRPLRAEFDPAALFDRAVELLGHNDRPAALAHLDWAIGLGLRSADAHFRRGRLLYERRQWADAEADFTATLDLEPSHAEAHHQRGHAREQRSQYPAAIDDFTRALDLRAANPAHLLASRGLCRLNLGDDSSGAADLEDALRRNPDEPAALSALARWLTLGPADRRDSRRAAELATRADTAQPNQPAVRAALAAARLRLGEIDTAVKLLDATPPEKMTALELLLRALAAHRQGDAVRAKEFLQRGGERLRQSRPTPWDRRLLEALRAEVERAVGAPG